MKRILTLFFVFIFSFSFGQIIMEFSEPGTYSFSTSNLMDSIYIECWGAGGSGGGASSGGNQYNKRAGGGGGGGGYTSILLDDLDQSYVLSVGAGGNGTWMDGQAGNSTIFANSSTSLVLLASGGMGGQRGNDFDANGDGGVGGTGSFPGGNGANGYIFDGGGGGGSSASQLGAGISGNQEIGGIISQGGNGGNGGNGPQTSTVPYHGLNGSSPGGGGGGAYINQGQDYIGGSAVGGDGGDGLIKIELFGIYYSGFIFNDLDSNCQLGNDESGIPNLYLYLNELDLITQTDIFGNFYLPQLPIGSYSISILESVNTQLECFNVINFTVENVDSTQFLGEFGYRAQCTSPDVSIFAPSLRRCFDGRTIYVSACNQLNADQPLDSSYVDVELDPLLTVNSASLPYTDLGNNTFRFETGDINPGQCVNFTLSTTVSCDAQNGQTLCMDATLYPAEDCIFDSIPSDPITNDGIGGTLDGLPGPCTLPWDKSSLQVDGWCQGDSVYFSVTNTGDFGDGDMECYSPVWLTVDGVVTDTDSLQIQGGETVIYSYPASGQTFFLNAEQHPLHPGNSHPNAHVELCGDSTNWTPGVVNQLPQDDADPDVDIYCGQVTAPVDPNDKTGYPLGQTEEYYIQPNQQLQYVIRFQNVGTDTAFTVVVRDTLDIDLNIFTVTPGVSSHPYSFKMYGPRVLEWTFENIQLPDSTTNEEASNGFLTFHVDQVPDLAPETVINNDADIYFDFELPITTNTTVHKIFEGFVEVLNIEDLTIEGKEIFVYPNPTINLITIQSESVLNNKFKIYDQQGREVMNGKLKGKNTEVSLGKLSRGTYTIQVDGNYKPAVIIKQ